MAEPSEPKREQCEPSVASASAAAIRIIALSGPSVGRELLLEEGVPFRVGRADECAFTISDEEIAPCHLEVRNEGGIVSLRDLGTSAGSYYHGARFTEIRVPLGAMIHIGQTELRLQSTTPPGGLFPSSSHRFGDLLGKSIKMREVYAVLERVAETDTPVLIEGETGTGKELCAEALHAASERRKGPFLVCDLAGVSPMLIESELYGHVRGAFTGADRDRIGAFEQAQRGSIFLDELGELDLVAQPRLLRALERRQVKPVGASAYRDASARVIAATNRDLTVEIKAGRFREDLYHRLAVIRVILPPLRERKEDIPMLCEAFVAGRTEIPPDTMAALLDYDWPGNVRELKNVLERAVSLAPRGGPLEAALLGIDRSSESGLRYLPTGASYREAKERLLSTWERTFIQDLLQREGGNISRAARKGGIDRVYLHRLIKKHGIEA